MKISELQELLKEVREQYGDVPIVVKHCGVDSPYDNIHGMGEVWYGNGLGYIPALVSD